MGAGEGRSPPRAPVGFEEEDGRFDPQNRRFPGRLLKIRTFGPLGTDVPLQKRASVVPPWIGWIPPVYTRERSISKGPNRDPQ